MIKLQNSKDASSSFMTTFYKRLQLLQKQVDYMAYVYAIIANLSIVFLQLNMKIVTSYIHPFHALALRGFFLLIINSVVIHYSLGVQLNIKSPQIFRIVVKRLFFSAITVTFFLAPLKYLPAGNVNALFNTAPIIVCFIQYFKYNVQIWFYQHLEKLNMSHFILILISFTGVLLVTQPSFIFGQSAKTSYQPYKFLMIFSFLSAITNSLSMIYLHDLKGKLPGIISLHYFYIMQCLFNSVLVTIQPMNFQQIVIDKTFFITLALLVIFSYFTQTFTTKAMLMKKPSYIMPFGYIAIIFSAIIDFAYFNHHFNFLSIIGMILTGSGLLIKLLIPQDDEQKQTIKMIPNPDIVLFYPLNNSNKNKIIKIKINNQLQINQKDKLIMVKTIIIQVSKIDQIQEIKINNVLIFKFNYTKYFLRINKNNQKVKNNKLNKNLLPKYLHFNKQINKIQQQKLFKKNQQTILKKQRKFQLK